MNIYFKKFNKSFVLNIIINIIIMKLIFKKYLKIIWSLSASRIYLERKVEIRVCGWWVETGAHDKYKFLGTMKELKIGLVTKCSNA